MFKNLFSKRENKKPEGEGKRISAEKAAELLNMSKDALLEFESTYRKAKNIEKNNDLFSYGAEEAIRSLPELTECEDPLLKRIVSELIEETAVYSYDRLKGEASAASYLPGSQEDITKEKLMSVPEAVRPQCTGTLMPKDCKGNAGEFILGFLKEYMETGKRGPYVMFRQGLDILDIDPVIYEMLGRNKSSIEHWMPELVEAAKGSDFFKIPSTTIIRVPMTLLQLTRTDYVKLNPTTRAVINLYAKKIFGLPNDPENDDARFVKTGTYSSKFNFANACIRGKELNDLGEYLVFIQNQAVMMAGPLSQPSIYGVSTTNTWACREYIKNKDAKFSIYNGLPLHTEYRIFVDCDSDEVLGVVEYWDKDAMTERFAKGRDSETANKKHDLVSFLAAYPEMHKRFIENRERVELAVQEFLPALDLTGQWSLDVMQNGDDFWLIDMALAENSAFYDTAVPVKKRHPAKENWLSDHETAEGSAS